SPGQKLTGQKLIIQCHRALQDFGQLASGQDYQSVTNVGYFVLRSSGGITAMNEVLNRNPKMLVPPGSEINAQTFKHKTATKTLRLPSLGEPASVRIFDKVPTPYNILPPWQFVSDFTLQGRQPYNYQPFFYWDEHRTYFVMPGPPKQEDDPNVPHRD